jgi:hypothetical protein
LLIETISLFAPMPDDVPRNRKERRAAAKQNGTSVLEPPKSLPKIKMARPDYSRPTGKTLMDVYDEKRAMLDRGQPLDSKSQKDVLSAMQNESDNIIFAGLSDGEEAIGPIGDAIVWTTCLSMLHFTLDVLVYSQYAQEIVWRAIMTRSATIAPVLFLLVYLLRSGTSRRFSTSRQIVFLALAIGTGCYTIYMGNTFEYFAVMKQAPPLGTLWIWSVIEMDLPFAVASVVIDLGFLWWNGFSAF